MSMLMLSWCSCGHEVHHILLVHDVLQGVMGLGLALGLALGLGLRLHVFNLGLGLGLGFRLGL